MFYSLKRVLSSEHVTENELSSILNNPCRRGPDLDLRHAALDASVLHARVGGLHLADFGKVTTRKRC